MGGSIGARHLGPPSAAKQCFRGYAGGVVERSMQRLQRQLAPAEFALCEALFSNGLRVTALQPGGTQRLEQLLLQNDKTFYDTVAITSLQVGTCPAA